jgi:hypothetical protein
VFCKAERSHPASQLNRAKSKQTTTADSLAGVCFAPDAERLDKTLEGANIKLGALAANILVAILYLELPRRSATARATRPRMYPAAPDASPMSPKPTTMATVRFGELIPEQGLAWHDSIFRATS